MLSNNKCQKFAVNGGVIREIDRSNRGEIDLIAQRMRQTLVDVLGEEKGGSMYTMEWLRDRVLWHLDETATTAKIFLSENQDGKITGQAIARIELSDDGEQYGYFSTIYVDPAFRRQGWAKSFLKCVEEWFTEKNMPKIIYNTAQSNSTVIDLFCKHGYAVTHTESDMVQLTKLL